MKARLFAAFAALALAVPQLLADARVDQWIAKARSAVGPESALNQVTSIHFSGTLETTEPPADGAVAPGKPLVLRIDIVFQKPYRQRMILRSDKVVETTALDDYDAWIRRADATDEKKWQLSLLDIQQVKRLRANTWENLNFYRGIDSRGGRIEFGGDTSLDGRECVKLVFIHADNIVFTRYFEKATGRLVKTETEQGGEIREEGEIVVDGLRFPRKLINRSPGGQLATITFDSVKVNEPLPADQFAVPPMAPPRL